MIAIFISLLVLSCAGTSTGAAIDPMSGDVSIDLVVPRGQTREEYLKSIIDYWTPERMASAKPMEAVVVKEDELLYLNNDRNTNNRAASILTPSALLPGTQAANPSVAGKAYFVMNGQNYLCSGSVCNANNRDTVITAAHCVFDKDKKAWATNWIFVPQYSQGSRPYGTYTMRKMATKQEWMDSGDFNNDVAIVLMNPNDNGQHIQDVTGGLGITLDPPKVTKTNSFGYPVNINNGETMSTCAGTSANAATLVSLLYNYKGTQLGSCGMTGGCSGGPWIQEFNTNAQTGQQVSVNSFLVSFVSNTIFGPYFTASNIGTLWLNNQDL